MKFSESGLPENSLVEDAFDYSRANMMANTTEALKDFGNQMQEIREQQTAMLNAERDENGMDENEYNQQKNEIEKDYKEHMRVGPAIIDRELTKLFVGRRVGPAKEIAAHSDFMTAETLAAVMLVDCVRSPVDFRNIETQFGAGVSDLIAQAAHIDAYPTEREQNLAKSSQGVRTVYQALLISTMVMHSIEIDANAKRGLQQTLAPGQAQQIFDDIKTVFGADKKLDARLVEVFNRLTTVAHSPYKFEVDADGTLDLVKGGAGNDKPKPKKPGGGNPGIGGDVF